MKLTDQEFHLVCNYILRTYGIDLSKKQFLIESKLSMELAKRQIETFTEFWSKLSNPMTGSELKQAMIDSLTTNYSYFYREESHFDFLRDTILPQHKREDENRMPFYIWCAGCASGQEVYTIAMQMLDCQKHGIWSGDFNIRGSDVSKNAIEKAERGVYPISDYVRLPGEWQHEYCVKSGGQFEMKNIVKKKVRFSMENLFEKPGISVKYDVIFCRNVLIYFNEESRKQLLQRLTDALATDGYLLIGHSETINIEKIPLEYVAPSIYRKLEGQ